MGKGVRFLKRTNLKVKLRFYQMFNYIFKNRVFTYTIFKSHVLKLQTQIDPKIRNGYHFYIPALVMEFSF